jgi:uncharacterized SAM-binding protein YcdF (DUF218 family)
VFTLDLAVLAFVAFLVSVIADSRSFRNAVFLGLALALGTLGLADRLAGVPGRSGHLLLLGLVVVVTLGPLLVACFLVENGITMARRENLRLANLLPLVAGVGIIAVIGLNLAAERTGSVKLGLLATVTTLVFGYVSFLLVSYVLYAWLYGRVAGLARRAEYVIVLGTGLGKRGQVTPLLASRLKRGRAVWAALAARGGRPMMIVSGGQGSDERTTEAAAMAAYLTERGFPAGQLVCEDRHDRGEPGVQQGDHGRGPAWRPGRKGRAVRDRDEQLPRVPHGDHRAQGRDPGPGDRVAHRRLLLAERHVARVRGGVPAVLGGEPGDLLRAGARPGRRRPGRAHLAR